MNAVIIGSGNVATHLAKALQSAGVQILQIYSQNINHASLLAKEVNAEAIDDLTKVVQADFGFISVKDDAIASVVEHLKHFKGIIVHTAGAVILDVFRDSFANYGVFYPLQTFSKTRAISFSTVPICVEASNEDVKLQLLKLATKLSEKVFEIDSSQRKVLHLAAVFACNFPNHLYQLAAHILQEHQMNFDILRPLILETAEKVQESLPALVQTGPAIRGDQETMQHHLKLLNENSVLAEIYNLLSNSIKSSK